MRVKNGYCGIRWKPTEEITDAEDLKFLEDINAALNEYLIENGEEIQDKIVKEIVDRMRIKGASNVIFGRGSYDD